MWTPLQQALVHAASILKMHALRARALGDAHEAQFLFHQAADLEWALAKDTGTSLEEARGLYQAAGVEPPTSTPEARQVALERRDRIRWLLNHRVWGHPCDPITIPTFSGDNDVRRDEAGNPLLVDFEHDFPPCIQYDIGWVNPATSEADDDDTLNTEFRVYIEAGPWYDQSTDPNVPIPEGGWNDYNKWMTSVDIRLCCGAPTMEGALLKLAALVEKFYDEDGKERNEG